MQLAATWIYMAWTKYLKNINKMQQFDNNTHYIKLNNTVMNLGFIAGLRSQ